MSPTVEATLTLHHVYAYKDVLYGCKCREFFGSEEHHDHGRQLTMPGSSRGTFTTAAGHCSSTLPVL